MSEPLLGNEARLNTAGTVQEKQPRHRRPWLTGPVRVKNRRCCWLMAMLCLMFAVWAVIFVSGFMNLDSTKGLCLPGGDTGHSCYIFRCGNQLGMAVCNAKNRCVCKPGYCFLNGACQLDAANLTASVVPVSAAQPEFPGPHGQVRTALCISGGGARSMSSTLGALRALERLGLMRRVDAISAVSGGSWAAALYMFANASKQEVLGDFRRPLKLESLTPNFLDAHQSMLGMAASRRMDEFITHDFSIHSKLQTLWERYVAESILAPAGLNRTDAFMAASADAVERIRRQNPALQDAPFVVPQPGRPKVFVINAAILAPLGLVASSSNVVSMQISPDYTGSPFYPDKAKVAYKEEFRRWILHPWSQRSRSFWVGGGFVETFAFGGAAPAEPQEGGGPGVQLPTPKMPFTLRTALAASSAAFGKLLAPMVNLAVKIDPEVHYWPVAREFQDAQLYQLGDGGNIDNTGLLASLQRGARRIVWLINTDTGVSDEEPFCQLGTHALAKWDPLGKVTDQVTDKFGFGRASTATWLSKNQVFAKEELPIMLCKIQRLKQQGRPAVVKSVHKVLPNSWWGIQGGFTVDIIFVYNEACTQFEKGLPPATQHLLDLGKDGPFANFPFYKTTFQNSLQFTALTPAQVALLAALAEYSVQENAADFAGLLGA